MSDKIKTCPFCGGDAVVDGCDATLWIVICTKCKASTGSQETKEEAIKIWNKNVKRHLSI